MKLLKKLFPILLIGLVVLFLNFSWTWTASASETESSSLKLIQFNSKTCPHCGAQKNFINGEIKEKFPELEIELISLSNQEAINKLKLLYTEHNVPQNKQGAVPVVFIGEEYFVGFDNAEGIGREIIDSIQAQLPADSQEPQEAESEDPDSDPEPQAGTTTTEGEIEKDTDTIELPLAGKIQPDNFSLPFLTVLMGILDGFNVCSLGALVLILGLVIALRSRKQILTFGGVFILTTAIIYGFLIVLWYKLFSTLAPYIRYMEYLIAILALTGAAYFLKEFYRMKKYGATCEGGLTEGFTNKLTKKVKGEIQKADKTNIAAVASSIFIFAAVITIVEFPCSAAVPVVYAGILADANLPGITYLAYISLFVFFYMLDELIIFAIAVWKMTVWMESPKFVTWVTFVEALVLAGLGFWYLIGI